MWNIILKNGKEILVNYDQKQKVSMVWDVFLKTKVNNKFSLEGEEYMVSEIRYIEKSKSSENRIASGTEMVLRTIQEYDKEIARFTRLSPKDKVTQRRKFMDMAFYIMSGNNVPEENLTKVRDILLDFFIENPDRMYPDMTPFKNLMQYTADVKQTDGGLRGDEAPRINTIMMGGKLLKTMLNDDMVRVSDMRKKVRA